MSRDSTAVREAQIVALFDARVLTNDEIGRRFCISNARVGQILKRHGRAACEADRPANARRQGESLQPGQRKPSTIEACRLVAAGLSFGVVARKLGMTRSAVAGAWNRRPREEDPS